MTQCVAFLKNFVTVEPTKNERTAMLRQLVKMNLVLLLILFLNGISNSYQQESTPVSKDVPKELLSALQHRKPLTLLP